MYGTINSQSEIPIILLAYPDLRKGRREVARNKTHKASMELINRRLDAAAVPLRSLVKVKSSLFHMHWQQLCLRASRNNR